MRYLAFATRNRKELLRDPLTLVFGIGLPLAILWLLSLLQRSLPKGPTHRSLSPGLAVFSFSFISLFSAMLIAKDRDSSYLMRLFARRFRRRGLYPGLHPAAPAGGDSTELSCFAAAVLWACPSTPGSWPRSPCWSRSAYSSCPWDSCSAPCSTTSRSGGVFALFVNLAAWLSGTWFDLGLVGGAFKSIAYALPFAHAVDAAGRCWPPTMGPFRSTAVGGRLHRGPVRPGHLLFRKKMKG
jgi:ABC-2 type transport system permease protein